MTVPPVADVNVTAKWPAASVVPVNGPAGLAAAPLLFVSVTVTVSPAAGTKPAPSPASLSRVTVKVCGALISLKALGVIEIRAFTQVLTAGPELPPVPLVVRVSDTPPTVRVVWAVTVDTPVVGDVIVVVHEPVPPSWCTGSAGSASTSRRSYPPS